MNKKLQLVLSLIVLTIFAKGQMWEQVGGGLSSSDTTYDPTVYALCTYKGKLYVGGDFTIAGGKKANYIASWDGKKWDTVGSGMNASVKALYVYKEQLYAGGDFTTAGGRYASKIAKWDGKKWMPLRFGVMWSYANTVAQNGCVRALCSYHDKLYVCGDFTDADNKPANGIAIWDSLQWAVVGKPLKEYKSFYNPDGAGISIWGYKLIIYNNKLYVGGMISDAGDLPGEYSSLEWANLDSIPGLIYVQNRIPPLFPLGVYKGKLLLCGGGRGNGYQFLRNEKYKGIVAWDDTTWSNIGGDMMGESQGQPGAMYTDINNLYIGGTFSKIGGTTANNIACWNGTSWHGLGNGLSGGTLHFGAQMTFKVSSLIIYNGYLYAGGYFNSSGNKQMYHIARWRLAKNRN